MSENNWDIILFGDAADVYMTRPMGMYRIANHLRSLGHRAKCLWTWSHVDFAMFKLVSRRHINPDVKVIGISATVIRNSADGKDQPFGVSLEEFNDRCAWLRSMAPNAKIVLGGAQIPYIDTAILKKLTHVDYIVSGQGESIVDHIITCINNKKRILTHNLTSPHILSDKFIPFNDFSNNRDLFHSEDGIMFGEPVPLELARGCIFRCKFCSYDLTGKNVGDFTKSRDNLVAELKHNYQHYGVQHYVVMDDLLNDSTEKVDLIHSVVNELDFDISFVGYLRLDLVRRYPKNLEKLQEAGLYAGFFGIESVIDSSGRAVGKGLGIERINQGLDIIHSVYGDNFFGEAGLILGLPHDDTDTKYRIVEWATDPRVSRVIKNISVQELGISTKFGHSDIDHDPEKFGYKILDNAAGTRYGTDRWKTDNYSSDQARDDVAWIYQQLNNQTSLEYSPSIWELPYMAYLYGDRREFLDMINRKSSISFDLHTQLTQRYFEQRKEYLKIMEQFR